MTCIFIGESHLTDNGQYLFGVFQKACNDTLLQRDRQGWLPSGSPFRNRTEDDSRICSVDIVSQHSVFVDQAPAMSFNLQLVTRGTTEAQEVARRIQALLDSGVMNECMNLHCVPEGGMDGRRIEALLPENVKIIQPYLDTNLQQPFLDQPSQLRLLTVPSFLKMLEVTNSVGVFACIHFVFACQYISAWGNTCKRNGLMCCLAPRPD